MMTELFKLDGHAFAPGHEPSVLDWVRFYINENSELLMVIGSGLASFWITLIVLRRIVAFFRRRWRNAQDAEDAAQEALMKLAAAEAQREPRAFRRAAPAAVEPEGQAEAEGWDGMEAAPADGYPDHHEGGRTAYGADRYGADRYGAAAHGAAAHGAPAHGAPAHAYAAGSGHAPRPGSFFSHRGERAAR